MLWTFVKYIFYKAKQLTKRHKKFFGADCHQIS